MTTLSWELKGFNFNIVLAALQELNEDGLNKLDLFLSRVKSDLVGGPGKWGHLCFIKQPGISDAF
jgi:hypothetical protein